MVRLDPHQFLCCLVYKNDVITHMIWVFLSFFKIFSFFWRGNENCTLNLPSHPIPVDRVRDALEYESCHFKSSGFIVLGFQMDLHRKTLSVSQKYSGHYVMFKWAPWKEAPLSSLSALETMILCVDLLYLDYSFQYMLPILVSLLTMKMPSVCSYFRNIP